MALGSSILGEGVLGVGESEPQGSLACDVVALNYTSVAYAVISGNVSALSGSFTLESISTGTISGDIASLSGKFLPSGLLSGNVSALSGSFTLVADNIGVLSGDVSALSGSFTANNIEYGALSSDVASLSGGFVPHGEIVGDVVGLSGSFTLQDSDIAVLTGDVVGLSGSFSAQEILSSTLYGDVFALSNDAKGALIGDVFSFEWQNNTVSYVDTKASLATVTNIRTGEVTRYTNYAFMSILNIDGKRIGVKSDGLYLLTGDTDYDPTLPTPVNATIVTKDFDFGSYQSKRVPYAYLHSDTETKITPYVDSVEKLPHLSSFGGRKTKLAKGPSGRFWKFKIEQISRLDGVELLPELGQRQRRVK